MIAILALIITHLKNKRKQEYFTWLAKYYSFQMRIKELRLLDSFSEENKDCSNYSIYESLKNKTQSEQIGSQTELLSPEEN